MNKEEIDILYDFANNEYTSYCYDWHGFDWRTILPLINKMIIYNKDLQHQLEEKDKVIEQIEKRCNQEISAATFQYERHKRNDTWQYIIAHKRILEILERGKNVNTTN